MPLSLSAQQLAASTILTSFFLVLSFSRTNPIPIGLGLSITAGTCWHVLAATYWTFLLHTIVITRADSLTVFRPGFDPFLPALVAYSSAALTVLMIILIAVALFRLPNHSMRSRVSFVLAALTLACAAAFTAFSPWRVQHALDAMTPQ